MTMKIYIMRHGEAGLLASSDAERTLTQRGKRESLAVISQSLAKMSTRIDKVFVSPYTRAQQTWEEIAPLLQVESVESCEDITPYGQSEEVYEYLCALAEEEQPESILLVSHLPLVGYLTAEFLSDSSAPMFPTSGLACVDFDVNSRQGRLIWQAKP